MPIQELASGFDSIQVSISKFPTLLVYVPLCLALYIGDELGRFIETHESLGALRARTLSRIPWKSAAESGVAGWSAASSSQASSSGVISKGVTCWSRKERRTSFTSSAGSVQFPARTCCSRKSSTSLASLIVTASICGEFKSLSNQVSNRIVPI